MFGFGTNSSSWHCSQEAFIPDHFRVISIFIVVVFITCICVFFFYRYFLKLRKIQQVETNDGAIDIIRTRYANGEIDSEEYEQMKTILSKHENLTRT